MIPSTTTDMERMCPVNSKLTQETLDHNTTASITLFSRFYIFLVIHMQVVLPHDTYIPATYFYSIMNLSKDVEITMPIILATEWMNEVTAILIYVLSQEEWKKKL